MQIPLLHQQLLIATERLRDMHRSVMTHSSPVPAAEMENLLQEIRNLYNLALQLSHENSLLLFNEIHIAASQQFAQQSIDLAQIQSKIEQAEKSKPIERKIQVEDVVAENSRQAVENITTKRKPLSDIHELYHDSPKVGDRFSDHQTLADKIAGNEKRRVSDNLKTGIKDIKSAIGINEKFQFINQLFNGDAKKYHSVIDEINSSNSEETALNHVREVSDTNNWEMHPATAKMFIEIIERRFLV